MLSRDIEIFRAVMIAGSATRAGKVLGLSQPAVSMALQRLERQAGVALFVRTGARLIPTQEAEFLLDDVKQHFFGMDQIQHRLMTLRHCGAGRVRIASFPGLGAGFLSRVLARLTAERERTLVSLEVMVSSEVRALALRGEIELGMVADSVSVSGLEHALFARYFGVVACPVGHPLASCSVITPQQLALYPFVALKPDDISSERLNAICCASGVTLQTVVESSYTFNLCELVRSGVGIAVVNPVTAVDYLHAGLVFRQFSERLDFAAFTVWPAGQTHSPFVRAMLVEMRKCLEADMQTLAEAMAATRPAASRPIELHRFSRAE